MTLIVKNLYDVKFTFQWFNFFKIKTTREKVQINTSIKIDKATSMIRLSINEGCKNIK